MKKKNDGIVAIVPSWPERKWCSFYADGFDPIWEDGTYGIRFGPKRSGLRVDDSKREDLRKRIRHAIKKSQKYIGELQAADRILAKGGKA